jgi:hypothetical protein
MLVRFSGISGSTATSRKRTGIQITNACVTASRALIGWLREHHPASKCYAGEVEKLRASAVRG